MSGLAEGFTNGPSSQKDTQMWERPWTLEEMRQNSANWSLAADSGLFLFLQDFSQRMLSKTHEIEKQLDSLIRDTKATDSRLHSVFNDFLMLSNTQFIENRVYDEEVEENVPKADGPEKQPEQEKTREQKEAELIPKMQEAVNYGLKVLDSAFEHLDIKAGNSDSEDEEVTDKVEAILEPKDLYVDRPLPYLIGSQAFMEQDDVGLGDLSSDEMSVDSDRDSVLDSEDGKEVAQSDEDVDQDEKISHNNIKKKSSMVSYDEEDEDSDIFGESDRDDDDEDDEDNTGNTGPSSFAEELAARIKGDAVIKAEGDRASIASKKKSKSRKGSKASKLQAEGHDDDMFKPPEMDDDDFSPFGGKGGLFSGGRGLFDDDDEGDLFSEAPKLPASEDKNLLNESLKSTAHAAESDKPGKKIPAGGISVFPENNVFISGKDSDSVRSKENGTPAPTRQPSSVAGFGGVGLFEDDDDDDDFFGGKSAKKSESAGPEKTKKSVDLFADDDEDGDIFSEKCSTPAQSAKDAAPEPTKHPKKKMPAGAISMFGPGTSSLLSEGLKKRHLSTSEESEKSEENGPAHVAGVKPPQKPQTRGLFSDDEDAQAIPAIPRSHSKPELTSQGKTSKAASLLFDDEEEEDLFTTAVKSNSKSSQAKASTVQPTKAVSTSLFSDDEDQWMTSKSSAGKPEVKSGGMKPSASAPSSLPSARSSHSSLFVDADDEDDDDLFAPKQEPSQAKPQRVSLLFEDEGDEYDGSLFGIKSAVNKNGAPPADTPSVSSQTSSHVGKWEKVAAPAEDKPLEQNKPTTKRPEAVPSSLLTESGESKQKAAGGVSLFEGTDVVGSKQTKLLDAANDADGFLSIDSPPLTVKKEEKATKTTFSLFDDNEEDESDWNKPIFTSSKANAKNTSKPAEEQAQAKSTGVFQDEELLFSQTQQKDNDPDVDLFATSGKASSAKVSLAKPATQSLFADEDEEDDLFSSVKPKAPPPKVSEKPRKPENSGSNVDSLSQKPTASPLKVKESSSRIGKLQASLLINPAALLPGVTPSLPGAVSVLPGAAPKSSAGVLSSSPDLTPMGTQVASEQGVSFDAPVQVTTLQSAHKSRAKITAQRRPQSRAARQQAAQTPAADEDAVLSHTGPAGLVLPSADKSSRAASTGFPAASVPSVSEATSRPLILTLPGTNAGKDKSAKGSNSTNVLQATEDDLFASDGLFGSTSASNAPTTTKTTQRQAVADAGLKKDKDRSTFPSIFEDNSDDLFQTSKPRLTNKKVKAASFLEEDDENEDIFHVSNTSTPTSTSSKEFKNSSSYSKPDIFQDEVTSVPKVEKKHKKTTDASLFDDNIDIFADLSDTVKPKQKSKSKGETRSIFDDNMDDIFSSSTIKPVTKVSSKTKKTPVIQETSAAADSSSIFDDPLNAIGGN